MQNSQNQPQQNAKQNPFIVPMALALSVSITSSALAAPGDTNSVNNGQAIQAGTYYNTPGSRSTFVNNAGKGGLVLGTGQTVRGLEKGAAGELTGHGGTLHFYAPGGLVRLDGTVNVSGLVRNGSYLGNGGRVFVDAAYLMQGGSIFANGINGGAIQFNVGAAMFGPNAKLQANGFGGLAGTIGINSSGVVDVAEGVIIDASGRHISTYEADNVNVNIIGSIVNNKGIIRANGVAVNDGHIALLGEDGTDPDLIPSIDMYAKRGDVDVVMPIKDASTTNGGVIRIVATGQTSTDCADCAVDKATAEGIVTVDEAAELKAIQADLLANGHEGDVVNTGTIEANGADASRTTLSEYDSDYILKGKPHHHHGDDVVTLTQLAGHGGTIIVSAAHNIENTGTISANGGQGLDTVVPEITTAKIVAQLPAPVSGGNGGLISLSAADSVINGKAVEISDDEPSGDSDSAMYRKISAPATGIIQANGGHGGSYVDNNNIKKIVTDKDKLGNAKAIAEVDLSETTAGDGGKGGAIAISYGKRLSNEGTIAAIGGNGGNGITATATAKATTVLGSTEAKAVAKAGQGGNGGNGGLVVLSGHTNPTGAGIITVKGGHGGGGGNAYATSTATSSELGRADAYSLAEAGQGGTAGNGGTIVTPTGIPSGGNAFVVDGGVGDQHGQAVAKATAEGSKIVLVDKIIGYTKGRNPRPIIIKVPQVQPNADATAIAKGNGYSNASATSNGTYSTSLTTTGSVYGSAGNIVQTQNNELVLHDNGSHTTAVLLTKGGRFNRLTARLNDATKRSVDSPLGGAGHDTPTTHLVIASVKKRNDDLVLNQSGDGYCETCFDGITSLTITTTGGVTVPGRASWNLGRKQGTEYDDYANGGGHISIVAPQGHILNKGELTTVGDHTGGSIALASSTLWNKGLIATYGDAGHQGTIVLKTSQTEPTLRQVFAGQLGLINTGVMGTFATQYSPFNSQIGGVIRLQSANLIWNDGLIASGAWDNGGAIIAKAGDVALNTGLVSASSIGSADVYAKTARIIDEPVEDIPVETFGTGGFIRWHGNAFAVNAGALVAKGGSTGGVIQLTAGGVPTNPTFDAQLGSLFSGTGIGVTQGTVPSLTNPSMISNVATVPIGSAVNTGVLDARGGDTNGTIDIAGDALAAIALGSEINGVTLTSTNAAAFWSNPDVAGSLTLTAGKGAVAAIACGGPTPQTPEVPSVSELPPPVLLPVTPFAFELGGLPFQNLRPDLVGKAQRKLILRLGKRNLFMAKAYTPITQEILTLAHKEYSLQLSQEVSRAKALEATVRYLQDAGIDPDMASSVLVAIGAKQYQVQAGVVDALTRLANITPATTTIRQ
jgi:hypothetical protein